mgnify:CR=1 FL=1
MSNHNKKTDKRKIAIAVLCVVLILAMIVPTVLSFIV